jgi:hypothetical protein
MDKLAYKAASTKPSLGTLIKDDYVIHTGGLVCLITEIAIP